MLFQKQIIRIAARVENCISRWEDCLMSSCASEHKGYLITKFDTHPLHNSIASLEVSDFTVLWTQPLFGHSEIEVNPNGNWVG